MLTDEDDISVWRASYEAFGTAHLSSDPDGSIPTQNPNITFNIRFPGQYYDAASGLHYNRFRYYSPDVGRYVSADPVGQFALQARYGASVAVQQSEYGAVSPNLYSYVFNNTLNKIDPSGLSSSDVGAIIAKSNSEVSATTARGERNPLGGRLGGALGNLNSVFFGGPAKGCSELADGLANALNDAFASEDFALDDNWRASVVTDSDYPGPYHNDGDPTEFNVLPHQTVIVESSNPDDPKIRLDPQRGRVRIDW